MLVVLLSVWGLLLARMGYVQLFRWKHYETLAQKQHTDSLRLSPERGRVFDYQGRALTVNQSYSLVYAWPRKVRAKDSLAAILAGAGLGTKQEVRDELDRHDHMFCFRQHIDPIHAGSLWQRIVKCRFGDCTAVESESRRLYPYGATCANVVGFVGNNRGLAGVEAWYDSVLRGQSGWVLMQLDGAGHRLPYPSYPRFEPVPGTDIHLTLDVDIQGICFRTLSRTVTETRARKGSVVVLDVKTGGVLALANYPTYDPARFENFDASLYRCMPVCDQFEPGSSFKIAICAAALESPNAARLTSQTYDVSSGYIEIMGHRIYDVHEHGILDFDGLIVQSSNPGVALLSSEVDPERFYLITRGMGFGSRVGIGLPGEVKGMLDKPSRLNPLRFANIAFGQGVAVSLLQLAAAYLCIANDGVYVQPYFVRSVETNGRIIYQSSRIELRRAIKESTAAQMKRILAEVVTEGTGLRAQIPGVEACGKTGTAQKIEPDGKYSRTRAWMSFAGFFPRAEPRYVIAVMIDEPKTIRFASSCACPVFRKIGEQLLMLEHMRSHKEFVDSRVGQEIAAMDRKEVR